MGNQQSQQADKAAAAKAGPAAEQKAAPTPAAPAAPEPKILDINNSKVAVTFEIPADAEKYDKILDMKAFKEWRAKVDKEFLIKTILIQSVDMFGPRVGFLKFKAGVSDKDGTVLPSIVFMRGAAVAMLIIIEDDTGKKYTVLTVQPRFPTGKYAFADLPAGMLDDSGDFAGVAAKELKEETGIIVAGKDLIDLTELAFGKDSGVFPSCGGCDEFLRFFLYRTKLTGQQVKDLQGKCTGVLEEGEKIKLKVIPFDELWNAVPDAKALCALCLYENLEKKGKIPPPKP